MPAISNALVIGAGIGGLTAAIALRQQGIDVDVVEISPSMSVYGVGIIQPNNTLRALDQIDLAKSCVDAGGPFQDGNSLTQTESAWRKWRTSNRCCAVLSAE